MIRWFGCGLVIALTAASASGQTADVITEVFEGLELLRPNPFGGVPVAQRNGPGFIQTWDGVMYIGPGRGSGRPARPVITQTGAPKLDPHGDPLPAGAGARFGTVRLRHGAEVAALAFSRDAKLLCTVSGSDAGVKAWDTATGKELARLDTRATLIGLAGDGSAVLLDEHRCKIWVHTSTAVVRDLPEKTLPEGAPPTALAVNPSGKSFAVAVGGKVLVIDTQTGKTLDELKLPPVGENNNNMRRFRRIQIPNQQDDQQTYQAAKLVYSPDGKWLAGSGHQSGVWLWDLRTGKRVRTYRTEIDFPDYAFSPDVTKIAVTGSRLHLYPLDAEEPVEEFKVPESAGLLAVRFSADGKLIHTVSQNGTTRPYVAATGEAKDAVAAPDANLRAPFELALDGTVVAGTDSSGGLRIWNPKTGKGPEVNRLPALSDASFSADGKTVTVIDQTKKVRAFDAATGAAGKVLDLDLTDDGWPARWIGHPRWVATFARNGDEPEIRFIEVDTKKVISKYPIPAGVGFPAVSAAGANRDRVALLYPSSIVVLNPVTGKTVRTIGTNQPENLGLGALAPDGRVVACATTRGLTVWEVATGKKRVTLDGVQNPSTLTFGADSRLLAACDYSGTLAIYDLQAGRLVRKIQTTDDGDVPSVLGFSPDGTRVAAGFNAGFVTVWDVPTGDRLAPFAGHDGTVTSVAFAPDGKRFVTTAVDGTALVWDVPEKPLQPGPVEVTVTGLDEAFKLLGSGDPAQAQRAFEYFYRRPADAVKQIAARVHVPAPVPAAQLAQYVADLESEDFPTRENACKALEKIGGEAAPALRAALEKSTNAEVRKRATELIGKLETPAPKPDDLKALRAVEVLEGVRTPEAVELLEKWARGPVGGCITTEAAAALARLKASGVK